MNRNLGENKLRGRRRSRDPMRSYDALPTPLRQWLAQAALPWSPESARKIWNRAQSKGFNPDEALALLARAESKTLASERRTTLASQTKHGLENAE